MQLFSRALPADCNIYLASDLHIGSINTHYDGIHQFVETLAKDRKGYAILLGDLAEAICVDDKRFDPETADLSLSTPMMQYQKVVELFKPVAKKLLYINEGNHDAKVGRVISFVRDVVCKELDVPFGTYSSKFTVCDSQGNRKFKVFTTHGFGQVSSTADDPIRARSNMQLSLKKKLKGKAGDCAMMACGHTHKLLVTPPTHNLYLTDDGSRIKQHYLTPNDADEYIHPDHRWYANTGSFLKLYALGASGYAEKFGYDPVELGMVVARVQDWKIQHVDTVVL